MELWSGEAKVGTLCKTLGISSAVGTGLGDSLETAGWISRRTPLDDRRTSYLSLTEWGRSQINAALQGREVS